MQVYALIKNNIVENIVVWDGKGKLFDGYEVIEITKQTFISPGFNAFKDQNGKWLFQPPLDDEGAEDNGD